jgi:hypothetical protein
VVQGYYLKIRQLRIGGIGLLNRNTVIRIVFMAIISAVLLTGCIENQMHIKVNINGSVDMEYQLLVEESALTLGLGTILDKIEERAVESGFSAEAISVEDKEGLVVSKRYKNIGELSQLTSGSNSSPVGGGKTALSDSNFTIDRGIFINRYIINANIDMMDMLPKEMVDVVGSEIFNIILPELALDMYITMPMKIQHHNADLALNGERTVMWNLKPGQRKNISFQVDVPNITTLIIVSLMMIVLISLLIWNMLIRKSRTTS